MLNEINILVKKITTTECLFFLIICIALLFMFMANKMYNNNNTEELLSNEDFLIIQEYVKVNGTAGRIYTNNVPEFTIKFSGVYLDWISKDNVIVMRDWRGDYPSYSSVVVKDQYIIDLMKRISKNLYDKME